MALSRALVVGSLSVLMACSGSSDGPGAVSTSSRPLWFDDEIAPIGQPVIIGGAAVLYETRGKHLWLTALDPETGRMLWSREATPSYTTPGVGLEPEAVGSKDRRLVAVLGRRRDHALRADLLVLEPMTGKVVQKVAGEYFRSTPSECADEKDLCITMVGRDDQNVAMTLDLATGRFETAPGAPSAWSAREIGSHGLLDTGEREPREEGIARVVDGQVLWRRNTEDLFGPGSTTDNGWSFGYDEKNNLFVGTVGVPYAGTYDRRIVELSRYRTVALDAETGHVRWAAPGTERFCNRDDDDGLLVRCEIAGTERVRIAPDGSHESSFEDLSSTLQGYDPRTGKTNWSVALGDDETLQGGDAVVPKASRTSVLLKTADGLRVVDLANGAQRTPRNDEDFVCVETSEYSYTDPVYAAGKAIYVHRGGEKVRLCDASGRTTGGRMSASLAEVSGASVSDIVVVTTDRGVAAYRK